MSYKKIVVDVDEWDKWCKEIYSDLEPYDHYDTGYRDAIDYIDWWMNATQSIIDTDTGLIGQYRWERDVAIGQLEDLGISFGQKIDGVYLTKEEYEELLDYKWMHNKL